MWVNKTVQETETATIKEEEVLKDHNQEISLEAEEEAIVTIKMTTKTPTERMTPMTEQQ